MKWVTYAEMFSIETCSFLWPSLHLICSSECYRLTSSGGQIRHCAHGYCGLFGRSLRETRQRALEPDRRPQHRRRKLWERIRSSGWVGRARRRSTVALRASAAQDLCRTAAAGRPVGLAGHVRKQTSQVCEKDNHP